MKEKNNMFLPDFLMIPSILIRDKKIRPLDREVFGVIYWYSKMKNGRCTAGNNVIAAVLNSKSASVGDSLNRLEKSGYIQRFFSDKNRRNRLEIKPLIALAKVPSFDVTSFNVTSSEGTVPSNDGTYVPSNDGQNNNIINKKEKKNISAPEKISGFDQFWQQYPRKEEKKKARAIWDRQNYDDVLPQILAFLSVANKSERWRKENIKFIKQPTTFLNGECWEDDPDNYPPARSNVKETLGVYKSKNGIDVPESGKMINS